MLLSTPRQMESKSIRERGGEEQQFPQLAYLPRPLLSVVLAINCPHLQTSLG